MSAQNRNNGGFTLIELMVDGRHFDRCRRSSGPRVPSVARAIATSTGDTEIATQLMLARMAAMNRNRSVDVTVQTSAGAVHISAIAPASGAQSSRTKCSNTCRDL